METAIIKIVVLLLILILPFAGPKRRRRNEFAESTKTEVRSNYCVNERGELEEVEKLNT